MDGGGTMIKNYIIKISGSSKDHRITKERVRELFLDLNHELEADVEFITQPVAEKRNGRFCLYGLESRKVLTNTL